MNPSECKLASKKPASSCERSCKGGKGRLADSYLEKKKTRTWKAAERAKKLSVNGL